MNVVRRIQRRVEHFRNRRVVPRCPRHDDIYLVEFPKSGVTWLCFIIAGLMRQKNAIDKSVNFFNVHDFVPDVHASRDISEATPTLSGTRIIKSHARVNEYYTKVIYLWRDPREVMRSYYRFLCTLGQYEGPYGRFVRDPNVGVPAWREHARGWLLDSRRMTRMIYLSYDELKRDTGEAIRGLMDGLGVAASDSEIQAAVRGSEYELMRQLEDKWHTLDARMRNRTIFDERFRFVGNQMEIAEDEDEYIMDECRDVIELLR